MHQWRTHNCGQLTEKNVGEKVKLAGWLHAKRDHGGVFFIDLRDHYGSTQVVTSNQEPKLKKLAEERYHEFASLSYETVVVVTGTVVKRNEETVNRDLATGMIEVILEDYHVESKADPLPLNVNSDQQFPEELRLTYRFLDLRRQKLHNNIVLRSKVIAYLRQKMQEQGFMEFQTPILTASSPEGARDFLVPSRLHPGKFYALPQAPQQFKQLLMVAGFDRYFQIAPCFRDEDARRDRAPGEFYQLDIEMSFVTQEDVFAAIEPVIHGVFKTFSQYETGSYPFQRITYADSMLKYGSDKPDLRNPIEISDATDVFVSSGFGIFTSAIAVGNVIRAIPAPQTADKPRSFFDKMISFAQTELGAKGLAYITFDAQNEAKGPIAKFLAPEKLQQLRMQAGLKAGDAVFFTCGSSAEAASLAGKVRIKLGEELELINANTYKFCWIVDFPMFEWNAEEKKVDFSHNPFSMPQGGMATLQAADTVEKQLAIVAYQYDLVCNGIELCSGAIRNHLPEVMYKAFDIVGYGKEVVDDRFSGLINAFRYGAPPHGGLAPGVDRIVMLLADEPNIREVICFPMNQNAQDLMMHAPAEVTERQLSELNIMLKPKLQKKTTTE